MKGRPFGWPFLFYKTLTLPYSYSAFIMPNLLSKDL